MLKLKCPLKIYSFLLVCFVLYFYGCHAYTGSDIMTITCKEFSELTPAELYEILKLRCDIFIVEQNCPYPDIDGLDPRSMHMTIWEEGALAAYIRLLPEGLSFADAASIGRVTVNRDFRRGGRARAIMLEGIRYIKESFGADKIKISAQQYLIEFYSSLGFSPCSEGYLEDGIPHIDMVYTLL